eukprot:PhF_6_TR41040/c0_g1_i2/m.62165/K06268/PPP3R, CNB; serine/threonine-protein phosphatase 2B regulatory subunit
MGSCNSKPNQRDQHPPARLLHAGDLNTSQQTLSPGASANGEHTKSPDTRSLNPPLSPQQLASPRDMLSNTFGSFRAQSRLKLKDAKSFATNTYFTPDEVTALHDTFYRISSMNTDDGVIDRQEFRRAAGQGTYFVDRLFNIIDSDHNGTIDFKEYLNGISVFSERATLEEKTRFCFQVYDESGDGVISRKEMVTMLTAALTDRGLSLETSEIESIVDSTLTSMGVDKEKGITYEVFAKFAVRCPATLHNMTITVPLNRQKAK